MKVLWITFDGNWIEPLKKTLSDSNEIQLAIVSPLVSKMSKKEVVNGITYYSIICKKGDNLKKMTLRYANSYKVAIEDFCPDVIHIHGTENNFGQIYRFLSNIPIVISIQGILTGSLLYSRNFLSPFELLRYRSLKNWFGYGGLLLNEKGFKRGIKNYETDILMHNKYFIGRTEWDLAQIKTHNQNAQYFHGEELLRKVFMENANKWSLNKCDRFTIFMPGGFNPIKGLHWAVETIAILKKSYPTIKLLVPRISHSSMYDKGIKSMIVGEDFLRSIRMRIKSLELEENIIFLGTLTAEEMCNNMLKCSVFISPSSIDNSPNAVGEAMMLGVPIVSSAVGGVPSFLSNEVNALLVPSGDYSLMALQIARIFDDKKLATKLSQNAFNVASRRHNIENTKSQYINIYHNIVDHFEKEVKL